MVRCINKSLYVTTITYLWNNLFHFRIFFKKVQYNLQYYCCICEIYCSPDGKWIVSFFRAGVGLIPHARKKVWADAD